MNNLFWHYFIDNTDYPTPNKPCFIEVYNSIQIAYWQDDAKKWDNPVYGWLPHIYDGEGSYPPKVKRWAYIPNGFFD